MKKGYMVLRKIDGSLYSVHHKTPLQIGKWIREEDYKFIYDEPKKKYFYFFMMLKHALYFRDYKILDNPGTAWEIHKITYGKRTYGKIHLVLIGTGFQFEVPMKKTKRILIKTEVIE